MNERVLLSVQERVCALMSVHECDCMGKSEGPY